MARDSSGNYDLPAGNPVVTGTTISSTDHNNTMSDIADEIQDSLSRSGKGGMLADLEMNDQKITGLATPTVATDAATKGYVDSPGWTSTTATNGAGFTGTVTVRRSGNMVQVEGSLTYGTGAGWSDLCTLPSGYRPYNGVISIGYFMDHSNADALFLCVLSYGGDGSVYSSLHDNGTSLFGLPAAASGDTITFNTCFIAA